VETASHTSHYHIENNVGIGHRQPAPDAGGSCTGSHNDWLTLHSTGLQATSAAGINANSKWCRHLSD